ncbi:MAG: excinuclease ABC subunit UvrC [Fibrobacterales bacterium]
MITIEERLKELPHSSGVYLMKNDKDDIIYIGKAKNLKNRVQSYFRDNTSNLSHRAATLIQDKIESIDWIITDSDLEALILEANLIQKKIPKYNVRLKDDKHYPYICVTTSDPYPRLKVVRKAFKNKDRYFGPFSDVKSMRRVLDMIPKIFQLRNCSFEIPVKEPIRPCLSYHIKKCQAPCAGLCTEEQYNESIADILLLLEGKKKAVSRDLKIKMKKAADDKDFEQAAHYRDNIKALESLTRKQLVEISDTKANFDVIAIEHEEECATVVIMEYREGLLTERKNFDLECMLKQGYDELISEFILSYYHSSEMIPKEIFIKDDIEGSLALNEYLTKIKGSKVQVLTPQRGDKKKVLSLAQKNAKMLFIEQVARNMKEESIENSVGLLQKELSLTDLPIHIIGFDISHLGGTNTVASMVDFKNGRPDKSSYKKFNVKTVEGIDDFASMNEVVGRTVKRIYEGDLLKPNLIVVDGGKGQLSSAYATLVEYNLESVPMIGLAKRLEEVFFPGQPEPTLINHESPALKLLQWIRDETHRFAITFQRSKRTASLKRTWLEGIEGVGLKTKEKVYGVYATKKEFLEAPIDDLEIFLGKSKSKSILTYLKDKD